PGRCDLGGHYLLARTCQQGTCLQPAIEDCGLAACDAVVGCKSTCAGQQDCLGATYCNERTHTCATQKVLSALCAGDAECLSGYCTDGVCCNNRCAGACMSCRASETGQEVDGTCGEVLDGTDPSNECSIDANPCGTDGVCGQGRCRLATAAIVCTTAECV